jgi:hypothetical protein
VLAPPLRDALEVALHRLSCTRRVVRRDTLQDLLVLLERRRGRTGAQVVTSDMSISADPIESMRSR